MILTAIERLGCMLKAATFESHTAHLARVGFEGCALFDESKANLCKACGGSGIDKIKNDPTNVCGNFLERGVRDTGVPVCRECGGYGAVAK